MSRENDPIDQYVMGKLSEHGLVIPVSAEPKRLNPRAKLQYLETYGLPIDVNSADDILSYFQQAEDIGGIEYLHARAQGSMVAETTLILFRDKLDSTRLLYELHLAEGEAPTPRELFQAILTSDHLARATVEQKEVYSGSRMHGDRWDAERFIYRMINEFSPPGLRSWVKKAVLSQSDEGAIERWLIENTPNLSDGKREFHLSQMVAWQKERNERKVKVESFDDLSPERRKEVLEKRINRLLTNPATFDDALGLLSLLAIADQAEKLNILTHYAVQFGRIDDLQPILSRMKVGLSQVDLPDYTFRTVGRQIFSAYLNIVDIKNVPLILRELDEMGLERLCEHLGVNEEQLTIILAWRKISRTHAASIDEIKYLLTGAYLPKERVKRGRRRTREEIQEDSERARLMFAYSEVYNDLLYRRIVLLGEEGINYPSSVSGWFSTDVIRNVAIAKHAQGDFIALAPWLKKLMASSHYEASFEVGHIINGEYTF